MRRFWTNAAAAPCPDGYRVLLDGKPLRLPGSTGPLTVTQPALTHAIAAEWRTAPADFAPNSLPLTRLAATATERVANQAMATADALAGYAAHDLLCYRAGSPASLVDRQDSAWTPWLDWAADRFGARLRPTQGIMPIPQDPAALLALRDATRLVDPFALTALGILVPCFGSLILGLAVQHGALPAADALGTSLIDALYEEEKWGADPEATAQRAAVAREVAEAAWFLALVEGGARK